MRKLILCVTVLCLLFEVHFPALAKDAAENNFMSVSPATVEQYIASVYQHIDFGKKNSLSFDAFRNAYKGYLNLRNAGKLNSNKQLLTICDFTQSSSSPRLWIIDLKEKKVIMNDYVAHGQGSGEEFAKAFSNNENSHQSSLGFYVTGDTYLGDHGTSLRLYGMDNGFNSAAFDRAIVVHGADYVSPQFISSQKRLGRSWGCPAVSTKIAPRVINTIKDGTCLFIYYPQRNYLAKAYWMNKKVERLPEDVLTNDMLSPVDAVKEKAAPIFVYTPETEYLNPACNVSNDYLAAHYSPAKAVTADASEIDMEALVLNLGIIHRILP